VSTSTVSKVLNGRSDVSADTRRRVQAALVAHNYRRRNGVARGQSAIVDMVFQELESPWAMEIVRGAVEAAHRVGLSVGLTSLSEIAEGQSWVDRLVARGTRGVIFVLSSLSPRQENELHSRGVAFAVVDPRGELDPGVPSVGATNWAGALSATRYLLELGHRRIALITGPEDVLCSRARLDGYRSALETAGVIFDDSIVRFGDFHVEGGFRHAMELLSASDRPTAIFAGNDLQALGVIEAARRHHLRVPADLSVVGFDDLPLSRWTSPPLTTVRQPLAEMAATAVRLVLDQNEDPEVEAGSVELATSLVVRESTSPPSQ
jgi:DNA-binding LacI/PurR family transcriptional regulator